MVLHKCLALATSYALNPIESGFFSQNLPKNPENFVCFSGFLDKFCEKKPDSIGF